MNPTRLTRSLAAVVAIAAAATLTAFGSNDVTKTRIERSLAPTFAHLYVQRSAILGETGVTVTGIAAAASCDRGGPKVPDVGPGADWICIVAFHDDKNQVQNGKFELQVKADCTYVAGGPSNSSAWQPSPTRLARMSPTRPSNSTARSIPTGEDRRPRRTRGIGSRRPTS